MTYREEVLENLRKKISVVEEEEFTATFEKDFELTFKFKFSNSFLFVKNKDKWEYYPFWNRFIDEWESITFSFIPYTPQDGDLYYFITSSNEIGQCVFDKSILLHHLNKYVGNCFRTEEEAESHIDEICKKLGM